MSNHMQFGCGVRVATDKSPSGQGKGRSARWQLVIASLKMEEDTTLCSVL